MATTRAHRRSQAERFYRTYCPARTPEIEFIDFDYAVRDVRIPKGTTLCGFKDPRVSPFLATFFCVPGTPASIAAVHHSGSLKPNPTLLTKVTHVYQVLLDVPHALESVCADGIDAWSMGDGAQVPVRGGGWQYKIPEPHRHLRYVPPAEMAARRALSLV